MRGHTGPIATYNILYEEIQYETKSYYPEVRVRRYCQYEVSPETHN